MIEKAFNINYFNIYSDDENYYFFRSLEEIDVESIKNGTIIDENGQIVRLITDREFYGETKYKKDDKLSLEEILEHIKMHYNKHTNCISFSSNTNVILDYGRNTFNDRYIMIKVPKKELGNNVFNAGEYILKEINRILNDYYLTLDDDLTKYYFDYINNVRNNEQLESIKYRIMEEKNDEIREMFENGVTRITTSADYNALNEQQNLLKNKIILKINLMKKPILENMSNEFLVSIIGNAFSSLEVIHYGTVEEGIKELKPETIDVLSLLQQLEDRNDVRELKKEIITKINADSFNIKEDNLLKYDINAFNNNLTLDEIYRLTGGNIDYKTARNIYTKAYTLAKSRLRKEHVLEALKQNIDNEKYRSILEELDSNTYAIEEGITNRISNSNSINISESVNLLVSQEEMFILDYINSLDINEIEDILENPFTSLQGLIEDNYTDNYIKENWYANSIIDLIDWSYYGIKEELSEGQRTLLVENLLSNDFLDKYENLKKNGLSDKEIANIVFLQLIRKTDDINPKERFSLGELEEFLGCNKIKNTGINLKTYQRRALENINKSFTNNNYTSVILPTGTGKSYVALSMMHHLEQELKKLEESRDAKILYLAPNNYILEQLQRIIEKNYRDNFVDSDKDIIKKVLPNLTLATYSYLNSGKDKESIIHDKYDLIIFDELHRTGAEEWGKQVDKLLEDQPAKILGITATPERDADGKDMSEIFAKKYGYTDEDILLEKHLSYNMNIIDAIERGIIHNPNVINCEYSLVKDGSLEDLELRIDDILDNNIRSEVKKEYEELRNQISGADGIEKILKDNLKEDGKYIVFIPITRNNSGKYINTETNDEMTLSQAQCMIKQYQDLMNQFLFSGQYLSNNKEQLFSIYEKINNNINLSNNEIEYLENEKDNIGLLVRLHINSLPNELQTLSNDMALKISEYMNWDILEDTKIISKLKKKMKNEVNSYNMISDNSKKQNDIALSNFNSDNSSKKKFMFVMDMLNEGVHVNKIDGIIWFRPLNENSRILYLQQLGRCITAIGEDNIDDIPTIIDLVNNTLKVDILKGIEKETEDLKEIVNVCRWIENNKIPDINSGIKEERENAYIIKRLQREYDKYLDTEKLESQKVERKVIIEKIIEVGNKYDLWNYEYILENPIEQNNITSDKKELLTIFNVKGVLRKFADLEEVADENSSFTPEQYLEVIEAYCRKHHDWPRYGEYKKTCNGKTSHQLVSWTKRFCDNYKKYENGQKIKNELEKLKNKYYKEDITNKKYTELVKNYCKKYRKWPRDGDNKKVIGGKTSSQLYSWTKRFYMRYETYEDGKELKQELDKLKRKYQKERLTHKQYIEIVKKYCKRWGEWPNDEACDKVIDGKTGKQLINWIRRYYKKYETYKNEEELKQELDELKTEYTFTIEHYIKTIRKYCETYHEWPRDGEYDNSIEGKTGHQLMDWIRRFYKNYETYKNGEELKKELDKLNSEYGTEAKIIRYYIETIKGYCEKYGEFPKYNETEKEYNGKKGISLYDWVRKHGNVDFGETVKKEIESIKNKYSEDGKSEMVEKIEGYCREYGEWPKYMEYVKQYQGKTSHQLYLWIKNSGYNKGEFRHGKDLKIKLDELKSMYYKSKKKFNESKKEFDKEKHDKVVDMVITNKENRNERKVCENGPTI